MMELKNQAFILKLGMFMNKNYYTFFRNINLQGSIFYFLLYVGFLLALIHKRWIFG
jgi:hypothetical protein